MTLGDTKSNECHIQFVIIKVNFIACEIDRRSIKQGDPWIEKQINRIITEILLQ